MILHADRKAFLPRIERWSLGHRPTLENAIDLQTEVIVKMRRAMLLDNEDQMFVTSCACSARLARCRESALLAIGGKLIKGHNGSASIRRWCRRHVGEGSTN